ncbi:MAG: hypothetical protein NW208_06600 [Bryobacter sp.]|nr:hypothetical protein [Bryobacter sp.]
MATLVMTRTICCESFRTSGVRCDICPCRPENREAARQCEQMCEAMGARLRGGRGGLVSPFAQANAQLVQVNR